MIILVVAVVVVFVGAVFVSAVFVSAVFVSAVVGTSSVGHILVISAVVVFVLVRPGIRMRLVVGEFALVSDRSRLARTSLDRVFLAGSSLGTEQIPVVVAADRGRLVLAVLSGKSIVVAVGRGGTVAVVLGFDGAVFVGDPGGDAGPAVQAKVAVANAAFLGGYLAEGSPETVGTFAGHVVLGLDSGPHLVAGQFPEEALALVFAVQGAIGDGAGFELTMASLVSSVTNTRLSR